MRPKKFDLSPAAASLTGFASNVTGASFALTTTETTDGLAHRVSIKNDSGTDHSGKTVTLVGVDADGKTITEAVTGPGSSATVESTKYFKTLTSATPSATIGADTFDIGWVDEFVSNTIPMDPYQPDASLIVYISGTMTYSVEMTNDDIQADPAETQDSWVWMAVDTDFASATASVAKGVYSIPRAVRFRAESYSTTPTAHLYMNHEQR
jgi:hypothetical protein